MKIRRIDAFCVNPRWIFVRVETDNGLVGWGESIFARRVNAVLGAIADFAANLIGEDPRRIEDLWQRMFRGGFFRGGPVLAEAYDVAVAPHCPNGPISLAASLQVDACLPNVTMQEYSLGIHYNTGYAGLRAGEMEDYLLNPAAVAAQDGWLKIPDGPGLGIAVNEERVRERHQIWSLRDNNWRNADGTFAEG